MARARTELLSILEALDRIPPELADRQLENSSTRVFRAVRVGRKVGYGDRVRRVMCGFSGKQVGTVVDAVELDDGVIALVAVYQGEDFQFHSDAEVVVETDVQQKTVPLLPLNSRSRSIFDFTQD